MSNGYLIVWLVDCWVGQYVGPAALLVGGTVAHSSPAITKTNVCIFMKSVVCFSRSFRSGSHETAQQIGILHFP